MDTVQSKCLNHLVGRFRADAVHDGHQGHVYRAIRQRDSSGLTRPHPQDRLLQFFVQHTAPSNKFYVLTIKPRNLGTQIADCHIACSNLVAILPTDIGVRQTLNLPLNLFLIYLDWGDQVRDIYGTIVLYSQYPRSHNLLLSFLPNFSLLNLVRVLFLPWSADN